MKRLLSMITAVLLAVLTASAQNGTLNPTNPPEPQAKYKLTVTAQPAEAATTSGSGEYAVGTSVTVRATAKTNYVFKYWTKNGVQQSQTTTSFSVTMPAEDLKYVAVFEYQQPGYNPSNPPEPQVIYMEYPLYLVADPANGGSFNRTSSAKVKEGTTVSLKATPATGYKFEGWYKADGSSLSTNASFSFTMPGEATTLKARFIYSPTDPKEPSGNQEGVDNAADAVTIVARSYTREYGEANPTFGYEVTSGTIKSGQPVLSCSATKTSPVGVYDIIISKGTVSNSSVNLVNGTLTITPKTVTDDIITFTDANVKAICVQKWDTNGDGELSKAEAAAVTDIGTAFNQNKIITNFDEFQYFTGVKTVKTYAFNKCRKLASIKMPISVECIEDNSFMDCEMLSSVGFPDNDGFKLEGLAFQGCQSLTTITLPKNLTYINSNPFCNCQNLKTILVDADSPYYKSVDGVLYSKNGTRIIAYPIGKELTEYSVLDGTSTIVSYVFAYSKKLKKVNLPNSLTFIDAHSFAHCINLQSINLPGKVETLNMESFYGCTALKSVTIPSSVKSMGSTPFLGCTGLTSIVVESGNPKFDSRNNCNAIIETSSNKLLSGFKTTVIPSTVTTIDYSAFRNQTELTSITIPNSVTTIEAQAFFNCTGLTDVYSKIEEPLAISNDVFQYDLGSFQYAFTSATLHVPAGTKAKYLATDGWKNFGDRIVEDSAKRGDFTGDNEVNSTDLVVLVNMIMGRQEKVPEADLNGDGLVNSTDLVILVNLIMKRY